MLKGLTVHSILVEDVPAAVVETAMGQSRWSWEHSWETRGCVVADVAEVEDATAVVGVDEMVDVVIVIESAGSVAREATTDEIVRKIEI